MNAACSMRVRPPSFRAFSNEADAGSREEIATGQKGRADTCFSRTSPGFTLVEMLVVLAIIGLIVGLVGPRVLNYLGESRVKTARLQIESFASALDLFFIDAGRYPTGSEGLAALVQRPNGVDIWNGPYVKGGHVPKDPWGNAYQYRFPVENNPPYEILSYGSDGLEGGAGTAADISNVEH